MIRVWRAALVTVPHLRAGATWSSASRHFCKKNLPYVRLKGVKNKACASTQTSWSRSTLLLHKKTVPQHEQSDMFSLQLKTDKLKCWTNLFFFVTFYTLIHVFVFYHPVDAFEAFKLIQVFPTTIFHFERLPLWSYTDSTTVYITWTQMSLTKDGPQKVSR